MARNSLLGLLWVGVVIYAVGFAPPDQPDTLTLITRLSTGQWTGLNPVMIALFNLMGLWPVVYAALALPDGRGQAIPAWPFVLGSFALGAFALLPYLALRAPNPRFSGPTDRLLQILDARWLGWLLAMGTTLLLAYGTAAGNWPDFLYQWQTSRFIHVMSLDFCLLTLLVPTLLGDDMARRQIQQPARLWPLILLPLIGPALYLALRPPLPSSLSVAEE
jgi:hypothetical protein